MKRTLIFALAVLALTGCKGGGKTGAPDAADILDKDSSYAFGVVLGEDLKQTGLNFNPDEVAKGLKDTLGGKDARLTAEDAMEKIQLAFAQLSEKQGEANRQAENEFLAENAKKSGIQITASGLQYEVISEGTGPKPQDSDSVEVHYEGSLVSGDVFDSSYDRGETAIFPLGQVIPGWAEGIQLMSVGSNYRFYIPSDLGYGEQGAGQVIPPSSTLIFNVELISIQ